MKCNEIAAAIHKHMCENDNVRMYALKDRWGDIDSPAGLIFDDKQYIYFEGYGDASSSAIKAWNLALQYTPYAGVLSQATWTGNMKKIFSESGLFEIAQPDAEVNVGDIYLNELSNCAIVQENGQISTFFYGDFNAESDGGRIVPYFNDNGDYVLKYNGLAG